MFRLAAALVALAVVTLPGRADVPLPVAVLNDLKAATVYVKVTAGRVGATGSGFVFQVKDDEALVATNQHVVVLPRPFDRRPKRVEVVFHSGRGQREKVLPAVVLASDADRDLAVLRVKGVKGLAKAIDLSRKAPTTETMTVYALGFPYGEMLATSRGSPAVTVSKGTVSSVRENDKGETALVQIDADINPGNSGGPVVDEQGRLVGVAVARVRGSRIGLAIPPADVAAMLNGRLGQLVTRTVKAENGAAEVEIELHFIDALGKITKAAVRVARKVGSANPAGRRGERKPLPDADEYALAINSAAQKATVKITLKSADKGVVEYWVQPIYTNGGKSGIVAAPAVLRVDFSGSGATRVATPAAPRRPGGLFPKTQAAPPSGKVPEPKPSGVGIEVTDVAVPDLSAKRVLIGAGIGPACLTWAADANSFYHLDGAGTVRRVAYPGFREAAALKTGRQGSWLALSAEGVVLTLTDAQEVWLLDPNTLAVKSRVAIGTAKRVAAAPKSSFGYAAETGIAGGTLTVIDLKAGKKVKQYQAQDLTDKGLLPLDHAVLTPDGKRLFTTGGIEQIGRFAVDGPKVQLEEISPRLIQGRFNELCVSPAGDFVCAPCGGGNYGFAGYSRPGYGTFVFPSDDLKKPAATLRTGAYPLAVGFDATAGLVYAQNATAQLIVMDGEGMKQKEYKLAPRLSDVRQYLVHPAGKQVLLLSGGDGRNRTAPAAVFVAKLP